MQVQFFAGRESEFRPGRTNQPTPREGKPFGILELTNWEEPADYPLKGASVRDSLSVYFRRVEDVDALIEAAQALRDDMAAGREAVMERAKKVALPL